MMEWSRELGIPFDKIWKRLDAGWSVEEALTAGRHRIGSPNKKPANGSVLLELDGEIRSIKGWAKKVGLDPSTLQRRLRDLGWSLRDAITRPVRRRWD